MQDEHFMREWNAGHDRFTGDLDRALGALARHLGRRLHSVRSIGKPYERTGETPLARKARLSGMAVIGGLLTGTTLAALLAILAATAYPVPGHALATACTAPPALA